MSTSAGHEQLPGDLLDNLALTSFTVIALLSRIAAEHDLSLTQFRMMAILRDRTPAMAELAGFLGLERSSVSGLIDRAVQVSLTPAGHQLAAQVRGEVAGLIAPMTSALTPAEQKRLTQLLGKIL